MGRKSALTEVESRRLLIALAESGDNEAMAVLGLKLALLCDADGDCHAESILGCKKIERVRFEVKIGCGRADIVLFHRDGGLSLVEVKGNNSLREVLSGIGQLFMYQSELPLTPLGRQYRPKYVNKILASTISHAKAAKAIHACKLAGVHYAVLPTHKDVRRSFEKIGIVYGP